MKIELLTPDQHATVLAAYENKELFLQNTGYEYIDKKNLSDTGKDQLKENDAILKDTICGFSSFSNFRVCKKTGEIELRVQFNYGAEDNSMHFTGVGYVLLSELLNGFNS